MKKSDFDDLIWAIDTASAHFETLAALLTKPVGVAGLTRSQADALLVEIDPLRAHFEQVRECLLRLPRGDDGEEARAGEPLTAAGAAKLLKLSERALYGPRFRHARAACSGPRSVRFDREALLRGRPPEA